MYTTWVLGVKVCDNVLAPNLITSLAVKYILELSNVVKILLPQDCYSYGEIISKIIETMVWLKVKLNEPTTRIID